MASLNQKIFENLKSPFTCSHWEEQNYRVFSKKFFVLQKTPSLIWTKGAEMHTHFRAFFENFLRKNFTLHLFGITKPNDTLFHRKTEKIFFVLLRDDLFYLPKKKSLHLFPLRTVKCTPKISKNFLSLHLFGIGKSKRTLFSQKI